MHISSQDKPRLPLRLLVLGMALAVLHGPAKTWAANAAEGSVPQAQQPPPGGGSPAMPDAFPALAEAWWLGRISAIQAGQELGVSRSTFLRRAREWATARGLPAPS